MEQGIGWISTNMCHTRKDYIKRWVHLFIFTVIYVTKRLQRDAVVKLSISTNLMAKTCGARDRSDKYESDSDSYVIQQAVGASLHLYCDLCHQLVTERRCREIFNLYNLDGEDRWSKG